MQFTDSRWYDADPDAVWRVITDPDIYADVAPNLSRVTVLDGEGVGMRRECADTAGRSWTETCTAWEPGRGYAVEVNVAESPVHRRLFRSFAGEWSMETREDGVVVTMTFTYEPRYGPFGWVVEKFVDREAKRLTDAIFDGWGRELDAPAVRPVMS